jgi:hypothetical protein
MVALFELVHFPGQRETAWAQSTASAKPTAYLVKLIGVGIFGEEWHDHDSAGLECTPG